MLKEEIEPVLNSSKTVKVQFRTKFNFLEWGIVLENEIHSDADGTDYLLVGNLENKVDIGSIIKIKDGWNATF